MRERNFRTNVTQSIVVLPAMAVVAAALVGVYLGFGAEADGAPGVAANSDPTRGPLTGIAFGLSHTWATVVGAVAVGALAFFFAELNNGFQLLRVRSRMVSTTFLALTAAAPALFVADWSLLPAVCFILSLLPLLSAYQLPRPAPYVFHVGLLIGIGALAYPPLLLLLVVWTFSLAAFLRALDRRSFFALLLGASLPAYGLAAVGVWRGDIGTIFLPYVATFRFAAPSFAHVTWAQWLLGGFTALLGLVAVIHFYRTSYNDKIRTRMFFNVFALTEIVLLAALALQPQRADVLLRVLVANSAPLIGHYLTLARGQRFTAWFSFYLLLLGLVAAGCYAAELGLCGTSPAQTLDAAEDSAASALSSLRNIWPWLQGLWQSFIALF